MRIKDLGSRPASATLLRLFGRAERGQGPPITVERREIPYWRERGWTHIGNRYEGSYQTPYGAFQGWIEQERSGHMNFYLYNPSPEIQRHSHWTCFQHRGNDWYLIHMGRQPKDVSSGILTIERLITEAFENEDHTSFRKKNTLLDRREKLIGRFSEAARARQNTARVCTEIQRTNEFLESLEQIEADNNLLAISGPRRYIVSSLFLYDSFQKLTADPDEQFFFVTGPEVEGALVLDQWGELTRNRRSRGGVVADMPTTHNLLIKLEQFGHKFLAHFHSHPGKGADSTTPSGIDENFQKRLEIAGHLALMAIFSRDGFIRFVRLDQNFEIEIYGEGVENHAPGIYRLTNLS